MLYYVLLDGRINSFVKAIIICHMFVACLEFQSIFWEYCTIRWSWIKLSINWMKIHIVTSPNSFSWSNTYDRIELLSEFPFQPHEIWFRQHFCETWHSTVFTIQISSHLSGSSINLTEKFTRSWRMVSIFEIYSIIKIIIIKNHAFCSFRLWLKIPECHKVWKRFPDNLKMKSQIRTNEFENVFHDSIHNWPTFFDVSRSHMIFA